MLYLQGNSSPEEHAIYVWKHIIHKAAAKEVYIVAHSYGGNVATSLVSIMSLNHYESLCMVHMNVRFLYDRLMNKESVITFKSV